MEGEPSLKCLLFNYKCSSSKQLFLTAGHQLRRVTEVFRQEINKWDFFLGQEKPLHNGCVSSLCLPSFQELAGVQGTEAILRRGAQHQAQQQQQQQCGLLCLEHPGRVNMGQDISAPHPGDSTGLHVAFGGCLLMNQQPQCSSMSEMLLETCQI